MSKAFQCSFPGCDKVFKRRDYLTRHESNHSDVRPFGCPLCSISFARKDLLDKHKRSKTHTRFLELADGEEHEEDEPEAEAEAEHLQNRKRARTDPTPPSVNNVIEDTLGWLFSPEAEAVAAAVRDDTHDDRDIYEAFVDDDDDTQENPFTLSEAAALHEPVEYKLSESTLHKMLAFLKEEHIDTEAFDLFTMRRIDFFLTQYWNNFARTFPIIHRPTFDVNAYEKSNLNAVFLLCLISVGIACASTESQTYTEEYKIAVEIQKRLRKHLYDSVDNCDLSFVPLKLLQALLICDLFNMYYGDRSQQTQCRIYHAVTINVLKEMKLFTNITEPAIDPDNFNYATWCQWVRYESLKRIVFMGFITDTHASFFFQINPSVSVFDVQLELPYADSVWHARDTAEFVREYKRLPKELVVREGALDVDIHSQQHRYEDVFSNGNLIPNVKSENNWPNLLWSLRRMMSTQGNVVLRDKEYDFDCFPLFGRFVLVHGIISLIRHLRSSPLFDVGLAAKVEHGFISWRTYLHFHRTRATINCYDAVTPIFWANVSMMHVGLLGLYCNFEMLVRYTNSVVYQDVSWNHSPGRVRFDAIETSKARFLIQAWSKSRDGEHGLIQACLLLKTVFNDEDLVARVPHLAYSVYISALACWAYFYDEGTKFGQTISTKEFAMQFINSVLERQPKTELLSALLYYSKFVLAMHSKWMVMDEDKLKELTVLAQAL